MKGHALHPRKAGTRPAVQAGADLVIGRHPHVLQGFEVMPMGDGKAARRSLIAYSLGNFGFDQCMSRRRQSVVLKCTLGKDGVTSAEVLPVRLEQWRPRPATSAETKATLTRLKTLSAERNTQLSGSAIVLPDPKTRPGTQAWSHDDRGLRGPRSGGPYAAYTNSGHFS